MSEMEARKQVASPQNLPQVTAAVGSPSPRMIPSDELLKGAREIRIEHEGEVYRLLLTRNGKLILQK